MTTTYHQRVAAEKRTAILDAALHLFTEGGYERTSLARVAEAAGVSTATLFKQFPNKASLFEAIVVDFWSDDEPVALPEAGEPAEGLRLLGVQYAAILRRAGMAGLYRIVIAEAPRFPELARIQFDLGKARYFDTVKAYFAAEGAAGTLHVTDADMAATQFLGMIASYVLWPQLIIVDWELRDDEVPAVVDGAVATIMARHG